MEGRLSYYVFTYVAKYGKLLFLPPNSVVTLIKEPSKPGSESLTGTAQSDREVTDPDGE